MERLLRLLTLYRRTAIHLALLFILLAAACYPLSRRMIADLAGLLPGRLYQTMVAEALWTRLKLCLAVSAVITAAVSVLCILKMLHQRRAVVLAALGAALFAGGVAFSRLVILPPAIRMLTGILAGDYGQHITMSGYISFCLIFMTLVGLLFEEPLAVLLLFEVGLIQGADLGRRRKEVYLAVLIVLAILTPTQDAVTLILVMLPFMGLYELSILWLTILGRRKALRVDAHG
jgi:sec-independent protein translocase protein TatC